MFVDTCIELHHNYPYLHYNLFFLITGAGISPFGRYPSTFAAANPNFPNLSTFPPREMPPLGGLGAVHDPWRGYIYETLITTIFFLL